MRVLHIGLSSVWGGIESFALNYFRELHKDGVVFDFADIYGAGIAGSEEIYKLGGKIITVPNFKRHPLAAKKALAHLLREGNYDSVHIHMQTAANMVPALAAQDAEVIPVLHCHVTAAEGVVRNLLHRFFVGHLRKIPAVHAACGEQSGKWMWGSDDFIVIPNAISPECYAYSEVSHKRIRDEIGVDDNTKILGFVGRLESVKNPLFMLDIARAIKDKNLSCMIVVVGNGSLYDQMSATITQKKLETVIKLLGHRSDVAELLSAFDVYVLPSLHEAFSLSSVEAQTNGLSCLLSDTIPRENNLSGNVHFLKCNDTEAWIDKIKELLDEGCERKSATFMEDSPYNLHISAKRMRALYQQNIPLH